MAEDKQTVDVCYATSIDAGWLERYHPRIRAPDGFASTLAYGRLLTSAMLLVKVLRRRKIATMLKDTLIGTEDAIRHCRGLGGI